MRRVTGSRGSQSPLTFRTLSFQPIQKKTIQKEKKRFANHIYIFSLGTITQRLWGRSGPHDVVSKKHCFWPFWHSHTARQAFAAFPNFPTLEPVSKICGFGFWKHQLRVNAKPKQWRILLFAAKSVSVWTGPKSALSPGNLYQNQANMHHPWAQYGFLSPSALLHGESPMCVFTQCKMDTIYSQCGRFSQQLCEKKQFAYHVMTYKSRSSAGKALERRYTRLSAWCKTNSVVWMRPKRQNTPSKAHRDLTPSFIPLIGQILN